jgi:hypothetical protein
MVGKPEVTVPLQAIPEFIVEHRPETAAAN